MAAQAVGQDILGRPPAAEQRRVIALRQPDVVHRLRGGGVIVTQPMQLDRPVRGNCRKARAERNKPLLVQLPDELHPVERRFVKQVHRIASRL